MALCYMTRNLRIQSRTLSFLWKARAISCSSTNKDVQVKLRSDAQTIFRAALNAVSPQEMVKNNLSLHQNVLSVKDLEYTVDKNVSVVAFGKAVLGMTKAVQDILGHHIVGGVASIPHGLPDAIKASGNKELIEKTILDESSPITVIEGAKNNLPDKTAQFAAIKIKKAAENVGENDILVVLISGGGSALLPFPVHPITLEEKLLTIKGLASSGATINELNTVRKNLSDLKGGKLAKAAFPAKVITLILSDVIGDPLDIIASGPTVPDPSSPTDCLEIFRRLSAESKIPTAVTQYLQQAEKSREHQNQAKLQGFPHVQNVIVGSNRYAVDAAKKRAEAIGYTPIVLSTTLSGEARDIGDMYYDVAHLAWTGHKVDFSPVSEDLITENIANSITSARASRKPICIIGAGETTVTLKGTGIGGRSQEMALALALKVNHNMERFSVKLDKTSESQGGLVLLSAGTDGQDGPCPAAGAIAEPSQVAEALSDGLNPAEFLDNNDSYTFYSKFQNGRDHVVTGLTGTNVMDIQVLLVSPPFE